MTTLTAEFEQIEGLIERAKFDAIKYHGVDAGIGADVALNRFREHFRQAAAPQGREALEKLLQTARLLQQNSEGCAVNHHGLAFELGLPGWLVDTQKQIDEAQASLALTPAVAPDAGALRDALAEYARDLRRNSSGGDDYPWEIMAGVADYLDALLQRHPTAALSHNGTRKET